MIDSFNQVMLILLLVAPGYICYSIKEMWAMHREKSQFEKLLNSLVYSTVLWSPFWLLWLLFGMPPVKPEHGIVLFALSIIVIAIMSVLVFVLAFGITRIEQKEYLFDLGEKLGASVKRGQGTPLIEYIFNRPNKLSEIEITTNDGCVYGGKNIKKGDIAWGSHPFCGDISLVCDYFKQPNAKPKTLTREELENNNYVTRTYIAKETIKSIVYIMKQTS